MSSNGLTTSIARSALRQARIELRVQLTSWTALGWVMFPAIGLIVLFFLRDQEVMGSQVSLAQLGIPGLLAMNLISSGVMGVAGQLMTERDDGTLLRAKAIPHGMQAHLMANVLIFTGTSLIPVAALLVAASVLVDGVTPTSAGGWLRFVWVAVLGLFATLPIGALLGALMRSPVVLGISSLFLYGAMAISGIFYPLSALPGWLQWVGQCLPTYWLGIGLRSALLPPEAVALELGQSWRLWPMVVILGAWALVGLMFAPGALRRMARRQSGSQVAAARDRIMSRGY
ncbi:MAG: ABC transporter permease [Kineosporiaceae bacterium]|nr:ABC transporter permease [Kineosporiaceae bacterium]MBK7621890.1 ABC transporter permease [Kineosporiaceae bacterium]MBK8074197.1 ABC transporter permease [Kineosporiaceae bacterium]